jgi:hypothetical protein
VGARRGRRSGAPQPNHAQLGDRRLGAGGARTNARGHVSDDDRVVLAALRAYPVRSVTDFTVRGRRDAPDRDDRWRRRTPRSVSHPLHRPAARLGFPAPQCSSVGDGADRGPPSQARGSRSGSSSGWVNRDQNLPIRTAEHDRREAPALLACGPAAAHPPRRVGRSRPDEENVQSWTWPGQPS